MKATTVEIKNLEFDISVERARVIVPQETIGFEIPDRLKFFTTV